MSNKYEFEVLKVDDADVIFIRHFLEDKPYVILIDAGKYEHGDQIIRHMKDYYNTRRIDLAILTHPDNDHMGGFFALLDKNIEIGEFWLTAPECFLTPEDLKMEAGEKATKKMRIIFNKPTDDKINLIQELFSKGITPISMNSGHSHETLPIRVVAPNPEYYKEIALKMINDCGVPTEEEGDTSPYDEKAIIPDDEVLCVIDEDDDKSPYNCGSMVLLYTPNNDVKILITGDASCSSLNTMLGEYPEIRNIEILKVPHHGSKHNLNSQIIDALAPKVSYITAAGTKKHPSSAIVAYLSKYGNVYSTHKCNGYIRRGREVFRDNLGPVVPLKPKQVKNLMREERV